VSDDAFLIEISNVELSGSYKKITLEYVNKAKKQDKR
jgi:hypothetical protein